LINNFTADNVSSLFHEKKVHDLFKQFANEHLNGITLVNEKNATGAAV
jgi:hypothetical protein